MLCDIIPHDGKLFLLKIQKLNIQQIYRVDIAASSAGETGSCSSDERTDGFVRTAVTVSHPAVIHKSYCYTLIDVQAEL